MTNPDQQNQTQWPESREPWSLDALVTWLTEWQKKSIVEKLENWTEETKAKLDDIAAQLLKDTYVGNDGMLEKVVIGDKHYAMENTWNGELVIRSKGDRPLVIKNDWQGMIMGYRADTEAATIEPIKEEDQQGILSVLVTIHARVFPNSERYRNAWW